MTDRYRPLSAESARLLTLDAEPWLSCDDCFDLVDRHVEWVLDRAGEEVPAMTAHLAGCAACDEEARSLLVLVAQDAGIDPAEALDRLIGTPRG